MVNVPSDLSAPWSVDLKLVWGKEQFQRNVDCPFWEVKVT